MSEVWKDVVGYEGIYEVSNLGKIRSLNYNGTRTCKEMKGSPNKDGYIKLTLTKDKKKKTVLLHKLVADAFLENPDNLPIINHKDENKSNNNLSNIEWCTIPYNNSYGTRLERLSESNTNGKKSKTVYQYTLDGELVNVWPSANECGRNGFKTTCVSRCCLNKPHCNTYKGYKWSYAPL